MSKRIISYNVNGIRAALSKGLINWIQNYSPDILCFQEVKADSADIDIPLFEALGYNCYLHSAERKGYSGVMTLSKKEPLSVVRGMGNNRYDSEGRVLKTDFPGFTLVNVYIPSGTTGDLRQDFKMDFLHDFNSYLQNLRKSVENLLVCGDFNICHKPIDINHPEKHKTSSGFLPEEREWFDQLISSGFIDTFRLFNKQPDQYSWWSYRSGARKKNLGWRIDYHLVTASFEKNVQNAGILQDVVHSDHCPVSLELNN